MVAQLEKSDWTRTRIAERIEKSPGFISQACDAGSPTAPSPATMKLMQMVFADEIAAPMQLRESPHPPSELEIWRGRARRAEKKLAEVQSGLRRLLAATNDAPPVHGVSSDIDQTLRSSVDAAASTAESEIQERPPSYRAGAPSGGKRKP